ncbi:MAG: type II secretion system F family protein [Thermodesulfobacteriota bacterium]
MNNVQDLDRAPSILSRLRRRLPWRRLGMVLCGLLLLVSLGAPTPLDITLALFFLLAEASLVFYFKKPDPNRWFGQLSAGLKLGLTFIEAFERLKVHFPRQKKRWNHVIQDLENGASLVEACGRRLPWLPPRFLLTLAEGETCRDMFGLTGDYFLYESLEKQLRSIRNKSLAYPTLLLAVLGFLGIATSALIFPSFEQTFSEIGQPLPVLTQTAMIMVDVIRYALYTVLVLWLIHYLRKTLTYRGILNTWLDQLDRVFLVLFIKRLIGLGRTPQQALLASARIHGFKKYIQAATFLSQKAGNGQAGFHLERKEGRLPPGLVEILEAAASAGDIPAALDLFLTGGREQILGRAKIIYRRLELALHLLWALLGGLWIVSFYQPIFKLALFTD